jgi:hypothetical protein
MSFYSDQAGKFLQMASDIESRLEKEGNTLDDATYDQLDEQRESLQDQADAMIAADVQAALEKLAIDRVELAQCTDDLENAVKTIARLDQILSVVAAATELAVAIASANPGDIVSALKDAEAVVPKSVMAKFMPLAIGGTGLAMSASDDDEED